MTCRRCGDVMEFVTVERVQDCPEDVPLPRRGTANSAAFDLFMPKEVYVRPHQLMLIPSGFRFRLPYDKFGDIRPRSSARKLGLDVAGVIDPDYRGEVLISVTNMSNEVIKIDKGARIAQMLLLDANTHVGLIEGKVRCDTERGSNGLGSTGK